MGTCNKCGIQITLDKEHTRCDKCGEILYYYCNSCNVGFEIEDDGEKLPECKLCGYHICPTCGICKKDCKKYEWNNEIIKILQNEESIIQKSEKIIEYIINEKTSNERKNCIRNIPISYAKGRIKSLMAKTEGFRVKNEDDKDNFIVRIDELSEWNIGEEKTINQCRKEGTYGQEERDALNFLVCLGKFSVTWKEKLDENGKGTGEYYTLYKRINGIPCQYLSSENLIINECSKCKFQYPRGVEFCSNCSRKHGKNKGVPYKTKERLNQCDTCQMYRGDFKEHGKIR